ncbi:MAG: 30S ribosome-binding factor RbfA [Desulfuromonadaceae bacterium]|nr:30S ribosome-binding factor RbfA [Desulfuromonadaceae bacterium]
MSSQRAQRVGEQIQKELADLFLRGLRDPRVGFVTINSVDVTTDLSLARVYYTVMATDEDAEEKRRETQLGLESAVSFLRRELGKRLKLRHIPDLAFRYDTSIEYGCHIEQLLKEIHQNDGTE